MAMHLHKGRESSTPLPTLHLKYRLKGEGVTPTVGTLIKGTLQDGANAAILTTGETVRPIAVEVGKKVGEGKVKETGIHKVPVLGKKAVEVGGNMGKNAANETVSTVEKHVGNTANNAIDKTVDTAGDAAGRAKNVLGKLPGGLGKVFGSKK